jgi:hypothetical protein
MEYVQKIVVASDMVRCLDYVQLRAEHSEEQLTARRRLERTRGKGLLRHAALNVEDLLKNAFLKVLPRYIQKRFDPLNVGIFDRLDRFSVTTFVSAARKHNVFEAALDSVNLTPTSFETICKTASALKGLYNGEPYWTADLDGNEVTLATLTAAATDNIGTGAEQTSAQVLLSWLASRQRDPVLVALD